MWLCDKVITFKGVVQDKAIHSGLAVSTQVFISFQAAWETV